MSIEATVYTALSADGGMIALVNDRIYPMIAPDETADPYIVYTLISGENLISFSGVSTLERGLFQFDCYATSSVAARALSDYTITAIQANSSLGLGDISRRLDYFQETRLFNSSVDLSIWE